MTTPSPTEKPATSGTPRPSRLGKGLLAAVIVMLLPPLLLAAAIFMPGPLANPKVVIVPRGAHVIGVAIPLDQSGVIFNPTLFRFAARLLANDALKAGEYNLDPHQSIASIVVMMRDGHSVVRNFTVAEGLTSLEVAHLLEDNPALGGDTPPPAPEGSLLPESYRFIYGDSRAGLIARMQKAMQDTLGALWTQRDPSVPLKSPQEALIMASLIEKETGKPEERPRIARVFYNRLTHGMRLQSDPTVIYALTKGDGPLDHALDHRDLAANSPYNTYTNDGLPPGPICNPGRASLQAALHPENNDFLYFVADGNGSHLFTRDLNEHNRNVAKWEKIKAQENSVATPAAAAKPVAP